MKSGWPSTLWIIRHGESAGDMAGAAAPDFSSTQSGRRLDPRAPLSERGELQADDLGRWFADQAYDGGRPQVVLTSPYRCARPTAERINAQGGFDWSKVEYVVDERLRPRGGGVPPTGEGTRASSPEQAGARDVVERFYGRPPGGESWCDVIVRLCSVVDSLALHHADRRVLIVSHQSVVMALRYLLERLTAAQMLDIADQGEVANCGLTEYAARYNAQSNGGMALVRYNWARSLSGNGSAVPTPPPVV